MVTKSFLSRRTRYVHSCSHEVVISVLISSFTNMSVLFRTLPSTMTTTHWYEVHILFTYYVSCKPKMLTPCFPPYSFIFYYGTTFQRSGISDPFLTSVATNVVNNGITLPSNRAIEKLVLVDFSLVLPVCSFANSSSPSLASPSRHSTWPVKKFLIAFVCTFSLLLTWGSAPYCLGRYWRVQRPSQLALDNWYWLCDS